MSCATRKPNIVFVESDSMDGRIMGCLDHPAAYTPNMDRLADQGVMFRNTYCNNPICCPSRASMWSGLFTHHCEGWNNFKGLEPGAPTFMTHLEGGGYRSQIFGKTDYLSGAHTFRARVTPWTRSANLHLPTYTQPPPKVIETQDQQVRSGEWKNLEGAVEWLRASADSDQPFILYLGLHSPHPPFKTTRHWFDRIDPEKVTIPPGDELDHPVMEYMRAQKNWTHGFDGETARLVRRIYFAMIAEVDAMVGRVMEAVEELGLGDTTYFIYTSDHGEMAMEHRQFYKMVHYEASARVPLIITGPRVQRGAIIDDLASLVDIYPTLMDMGGLECPDGLDGHSLMSEVGGGQCSRPDWVLSEFHGTTSSTGAFMLRRGRWKYIAYVGCEPLLFDLETDPDELVNMAPTNPEVVKEMDDLLRKIVDYETVDAKAKEYDKRSFRQWRAEQLKEGTYRSLMGRIHTGWGPPSNHDELGWDDEKEKLIKQWLGEA